VKYLIPQESQRTNFCRNKSVTGLCSLHAWAGSNKSSSREDLLVIFVTKWGQMTVNHHGPHYPVNDMWALSLQHIGMILNDFWQYKQRWPYSRQERIKDLYITDRPAGSKNEDKQHSWDIRCLALETIMSTWGPHVKEEWNIKLRMTPQPVHNITVGHRPISDQNGTMAEQNRYWSAISADYLVTI